MAKTEHSNVTIDWIVANSDVVSEKVKTAFDDYTNLSWVSFDKILVKMRFGSDY